MVSDDKLLEFHPDTVVTIRRMYNLDKPGDMDKAVDALAEWLKKQHHFTKKEYSREYLERAIILRKGSVERAKYFTDKLCSLRSILPKFYEKYDARAIYKDLDQYYKSALLPQLTEDHYRVYVGQFVNNDITADILLQLYRLVALKAEYTMLHDYCNGYVVILDYRRVNIMEVFKAADLITLHQGIKLLMLGLGIRVKGIHILTESNTVDFIFKWFKPLLGPKVADRLHAHKNMDTVYNHVPKGILPSELGGYEESLAILHDKWKKSLGSEENIKHMKEMSKSVSNEAYKIKEQLNGLDLGLAGTFRTLNVD